MQLSYANRLASIALLVLATVGCNRQFAVTVNSQTVYSPRPAATGVQMADSDLQGCINLALRQPNAPQPADLQSLSCANAGISDLRGLENFTALRFLDLAGNRISDLTPLNRLPVLSGLNLPDNPLRDIAALLTMNSLTVVNLSGTEQIPCDQLDALESRLGPSLSTPERCAR